MMKGAGVRTFKHRAGMPVLGIVGKMMNTRVQRRMFAVARHLDSESRCRQGAGRQVLFELHLARRPGSVASVLERDPELRRGPSDMRFSS